MWIRFRDLSAAEQIVNAGSIEICQSVQHAGWNVPSAQFVIGITDLAAVQYPGQVSLGQILIFS